MSTYHISPWAFFGDELYAADGTRVAETVHENDKEIIRYAPEMLEALRIATDSALCNGVDPHTLSKPLSLLEKFNK